MLSVQLFLGGRGWLNEELLFESFALSKHSLILALSMICRKLMIWCQWKKQLALSMTF